MEFVQTYMCIVLLIQAKNLAVGQKSKISNETRTIYKIGVSMGLINPKNYSLLSFEKDEPRFKKMYKRFALRPDIVFKSMLFEKFLVMSNYGILKDTQEAIFQNKPRTRRSYKSKKSFKRILNTGDILISSRSDSGLIGHAAIMITDYWVLEMAGGSKYKKGIKSNNRLISAGDWYNDNSYEEITVYRCPDSWIAKEAAHWADTNYYNPDGGHEKTIHVTYKIIPDSFEYTNPSYSSKLVLQAYFSAGSGIIRDPKKYGPVIAPTNIPAYFKSPYHLEIVGKF